jgi:hypothetical protein
MVCAPVHAEQCGTDAFVCQPGDLADCGPDRLSSRGCVDKLVRVVPDARRIRPLGRRTPILVTSYCPSPDADADASSTAKGTNTTETALTNYSDNLVSFIWDVADLLRGPYRPPEYRKVMLPMTVLRRRRTLLHPPTAKWRASSVTAKPTLFFSSFQSLTDNSPQNASRHMLP